MEASLHLTIHSAQSAKTHTVCGDVVRWERSPEATVLVCADGQGSGMKAHLAATMLTTRALELLRGGFSLRRTFERLVGTMNEARGQSPIYTAFSLLRMLPDGMTTVLAYEAPPAIVIAAGQRPRLLQQHSEVIGDAVVTDGSCLLRPGDAILIVSDGITQAGLGATLRNGWEPARVVQFIEEERAAGAILSTLPDRIHRQALAYWGRSRGDDCTVALAICRQANRVTLLTGPPDNRVRDEHVVRDFIKAPGKKIICGGSTANLVARVLHKKMEVIPVDAAGITPPAYRLRGIDLVTEGAVTLNQLYNILDDDPSTWDESNPVTQLAHTLREADRIDLMIGAARNPAANSQAQRQLGVLERHRILPLLAQKLQDQGKTVVTVQV